MKHLNIRGSGSGCGGFAATLLINEFLNIKWIFKKFIFLLLKNGMVLKWNTLACENNLRISITREPFRDFGMNIHIGSQSA